MRSRFPWRRGFGRVTLATASLIAVLSAVGIGTPLLLLQNPKPATNVVVNAPLASSSTACTDAEAAGTVRYIRQGATGTDTGLNWTNAHTALPTSLTRGRTYCIADTTTGFGGYTFDDAKSGTTLITIAKATVADHGTSTGWLDSYGDGQASFTGWTFDLGTGYFLMDGGGGWTGESRTTGQGFLITNAVACNTEQVEIGPSGGSATTNITLKYVEVEGRGYGTATCFDRGIYNNATSGRSSNLTIQYSYIHDMYVPLLTRQMETILFEYNVVAYNNSSGAFHAEPWSDAGTDDVTVRYNTFINPEGTAVFAQFNSTGDTPVDTNTGTNWQIYGNLFYYDGSYSGDGVAYSIVCLYDASQHNFCDGWEFWNNTIHNFDFGYGGRIVQENATGVTVIRIRNNLWDGNSISVAHTNVNSDYNYYRDTTHTAEANQQVVTGGPSPFTAAGSGDFTLVAATNAGTATGSPAGNATDPNGVTRNGDGTWDRGAFEFVASIPEFFVRLRKPQ